MESPGHTVRINPAPKKPKVEAIPERESFPPGPPSTMSEETWQGMQPVLKALGATVNTKKQKVDAVYVNLDTRPDRRESIEEQLAKTGIKAKRLAALTGADATDDVVTRTWDTSLNSKYDPTTIKKGRVSLTPGERGCSMSHAVLWARCAAQGDEGPPLLVIEDDLILKKNAGETVQKLVKHIEETNPIPAQRLCLLYLTGDVADWVDKKATSIEGVSGVRLREARYVWQTACYVIWPAAARRLLASLPVDGPVDNFISKHILTQRVCALMTQPKLAWQNAPYEEGDIAHSGHYNNKRVRDAAPESPTKKIRVDINEAASPTTHLMHHLGELPGIGPKLAEILRTHARTLEGGLVEANQLKGIPGLGAKRQADIVRYLQLKCN
eukprot:Transcript_18503.p2 GENE.Transcript_18503~~Transcript_18503.p2  ORF type:complete len:383 (-),score=132.76 Transcript_18503:319-1467(-)